MARILVVDDEESIIDVLRLYLKRGKHQVSAVSDAAAATRLLNDGVFDLMLSDVKLPGIDGIELLRRAKAAQPQMAVIMMTAYADLDDAIHAMRSGAFDYIAKPFNLDELLLTIDRAVSFEQTIAENKLLRSSLKTTSHFDRLVGDSPAMLAVYDLINKVAKTGASVLVLGESGTGKELAARAVHENSAVGGGPFVSLNCAAIPDTLLETELFGHVKGAFTGASTDKPGLFETANGGSVFLDEVGAIPPATQKKLLRVLQEKEARRVGGTKNVKINARVIAATNEDLEAKVKAGEFRDDLFYRLSVIPIVMPPLRERQEDIPKLIAHFLSRVGLDEHRQINIDQQALAILDTYHWPGNVRELENVVMRMATLCDDGHVTEGDVPREIRKQVERKISGRQSESGFASPLDSGVVPLKDYVKEIEETYIMRTINKCEGDKEKAASKLGISLATLYRKFKFKGS